MHLILLSKCFSSEWTMLPRLQAWSVFPLNWTNIEASLQLLNYSCVLLSECFCVLLSEYSCVLLSEYSCVLLSEYFFCNLHFWMSKVNKLWWVNCVLFYCLPTAAAVALGCFYRWALSLPNFLKFLLKVSSVVYFTLYSSVSGLIWLLGLTLLPFLRLQLVPSSL